MQLEMEDQELKSEPSYHDSLELFKLPPTDVGVIQSHIEDVYPEHSPKGQNTPLDFFIRPSSTHYIDLHKSQLYLRCKVVTSAGASVATTSKTIPANFPFGSLFSNLDISVNNVNITSSSNNYPYAAYINRVLSNGTDAKVTKYSTELLLKENKGNPIDELSESFKTMKAARNQFELIGRIAHGMFDQEHKLPPGTSIRIKLRRTPNTFSVCGTDPATGSSFTDYIEIEEAILKCKKLVVNRQLVEKHEDKLSAGKKCEYPYKDFDAISYSIPTGSINHVSETIHNGAAPDAVVIGLVDSKGYSGTPSKSPFNFKHFNLSSVSVLLDGEPQVFKEIRMNVDEKVYLHAYSQLFNLLPPAEGGNGITPKDFAENGLCLLAFDLNNAVRENRFALNKTGSLKIHCTFSSALDQAVNVVCYLVNSKLMEIDAQKSVYLQ
jgi:hypothetical protein